MLTFSFDSYKGEYFVCNIWKSVYFSKNMRHKILADFIKNIWFRQVFQYLSLPKNLFLREFSPKYV